MRIISQEAFEVQQKEEMVVEACTPVTTDTSDLIDAFDNSFVPACTDIAIAIGDETFRGSFDDMVKLYQYILGIDVSTEYGKGKMFQAIILAIRWQAADALCNHESEKLGWKKPKWFVDMWKRYDDNQAAAQVESQVEAEDTQEAAE